jgi:hypothetical protein
MAPARALAGALAVPGDLARLADAEQRLGMPGDAPDAVAPERVAAAPPPTADPPAEPSPDDITVTGVVAQPLADMRELPVVVAHGRATVLIPKSTTPGTYAVLVGEGADNELSSVSLTFLTLEVSAPPAPRVVNTGLRSETDWTEARTAASPGSPLVGLGAGGLGAAALGTAAVLRPWRRRPRGR